MKASLMLAMAMLVAGLAIYPVVEVKLMPGGQFSNVPVTQRLLPGSYTPQQGGLLPPRSPYACPYGHFLDPVRQQCVPVSPGYPEGPQPSPYGQPYDPRVV